jgi:hypothetical protein
MDSLRGIAPNCRSAGIEFSASWDIAFTTKNSGKNPARRINIITSLFPLAGANELLADQAKICASAFAPRELGAFDTEFTLFPGQQFGPTTMTIVMTRLDEVRNGIILSVLLSCPYLIGCIDYQFLSSTDHHQTGFIFNIRRKKQDPNLQWGVNLDEGAAQAADLDLSISIIGTGPAN